MANSTKGLVVGNEPAHDTYTGTTSIYSSTFEEQLNAVVEPLYNVEVSATTLITVDPDVRGGVPCVGEDRWPISHILERIAAGASIEVIAEEFDGLTPGDIQTALEASAWVMRDPAIDWEKLDLPAMVEFQRETRDWDTLSDISLRD
jgi:uncharacterized protein (DUF433 family)